jgi:hypothetical protein
MTILLTRKALELDCSHRELTKTIHRILRENNGIIYLETINSPSTKRFPSIKDCNFHTLQLRREAVSTYQNSTKKASRSTLQEISILTKQNPIFLL